MEAFTQALESLAVVGPVMLAYAIVWWLAAFWLRDNSIVDISWGLGILLATLTGYLYFLPAGGSSLILLLVIALWAVRLAGMIALKNWGRGEDPRYAAWRKGWGRQAWWRSFLKVFLLQAVLMVVVALTPLAAFAGDGANPGLAITGVVVFTVGLLFESIGDWQLYRFKRNPANRGKLMTTGLWRYTRHPNYFGECLVWWGIGLVAVPSAGWAAAIAPVLVTYLVRFLSGVPMAERHYAGRQDFEAYARQTNTFVPWFPRRSQVD